MCYLWQVMQTTLALTDWGECYTSRPHESVSQFVNVIHPLLLGQVTFELGAIFIDESCCASLQGSASKGNRQAAWAAMKAAGLEDGNIHIVGMEDVLALSCPELAVPEQQLQCLLQVDRSFNAIIGSDLMWLLPHDCWS
jgi:hypothetical protein